MQQLGRFELLMIAAVAVCYFSSRLDFKSKIYCAW